MEANQKNKPGWLIPAGLFALIVIALVAWRTRLSAEEQMEREAIKAAKRIMLLQEKRIWTSPGLVKDWLFGKANEGHYVEIWRHSESNLLNRGYLVKRKFQFKHGTGSWKDFSAATDQRFKDEMWAYACLTSESSIEVVARSNAMPAWEALVREFDKPPVR